MTTFQLQHGPVTITVEGLPATVRPESVTIDVGIHSVFDGDYRGCVDAFVENFAALGGRDTFPQVDPSKRSSCGSYAVDRGLTSRLGLYPPDPPVVAGEEAIRAALNGQEAT